jgi:hypothetical protein
LGAFSSLLNCYAGKIFLKSQFRRPTAKVGLTKSLALLVHI